MVLVEIQAQLRNILSSVNIFVLRLLHFLMYLYMVCELHVLTLTNSICNEHLIINTILF
jgi:hypothetical protein